MNQQELPTNIISLTEEERLEVLAELILEILDDQISVEREEADDEQDTD